MKRTVIFPLLLFCFSAIGQNNIKYDLVFNNSQSFIKDSVALNSTGKFDLLVNNQEAKLKVVAELVNGGTVLRKLTFKSYNKFVNFNLMEFLKREGKVGYRMLIRIYEGSHYNKCLLTVNFYLK